MGYQEPPPPGSPSARALGCLCPEVDNEERVDGAYVITSRCPLHGHIVRNAAARRYRNDPAWLASLKPGDRVERVVGGSPMMSLAVDQVTRDRIVCGAWEFDRATGAEVDEELGWGPLGTGSWIRPVSN